MHLKNFVSSWKRDFTSRLCFNPHKTTNAGDFYVKCNVQESSSSPSYAVDCWRPGTGTLPGKKPRPDEGAGIGCEAFVSLPESSCFNTQLPATSPSLVQLLNLL
jgi:hypothetical protein